MSSRLDSVLQKHPDHAEGIRLIAARDPSKNLKYLDWSAKVLASGQALAPEIADVVELFHEFKGHALPSKRGKDGRVHLERIAHDLYTYRAQDFANLRDNLRRLKRTKNKKLRERERLYRLDGPVEADVVYDSDDLVVRHIKNKNASAHYGLSTKWCIAMNRERYFEDYETQNATFFFFERKAPIKNEYDKVALVLSRERGAADGTEGAYTALDNRVGLLDLANAYGARVFDIFRVVYERSLAHPPSAAFLTNRGAASAEQLEAVFAKINETPAYEIANTLESICCNDGAPFTLLKQISANAHKLVCAAFKRSTGLSGRRVRNKTRALKAAREVDRNVRAALAVHRAVPDDERAVIIKALRRSGVHVESIRVADGYNRIGVEYATRWGRDRSLRARKRLRLRRRHRDNPKNLLHRAEMMERRAVRMRKKAEKLATKLEAQKAKPKKLKKRPAR